MDDKHIKHNMEVIGADGVHIGVVDNVVGGRIRLAKKDQHGEHKHYRYLPLSLAADIEGHKVRLSANGAVAVELFESEL